MESLNFDYSSSPRTPSPHAEFYQPSLMQELYDYGEPTIPQQQVMNPHPHYYPMVRRATYPYEYPSYYYDDVKSEENHVVPTQYSPPLPPQQQSYVMPVQHTDDAASKETQYLRRRCFNCHTTEPPSWRRSTLNPGKIVCNKCGLYERTHLRPRPLRFDELRAGNKARKAKEAKVKKEPREMTLQRRASVGSENGEWDDAASIYSSSSNSSSSYNSPSLPSFQLERDSHSPPMLSPEMMAIRLPSNPLASLHHSASLDSFAHLPVVQRKKSNSLPYPSGWSHSDT